MRALPLARALLALAVPARAQLPRRWPRAPLTEVARAQVGADLAWERFGVRGEGSVLCLVDTGVDGTHRDLRADGAPRVRWLLDSFAAPRGRFADLEDRFGGAVWRGDEPGLPGDPHGHGTAMASIALGDGSDGADVGPTAGLAPEASLIVVRAFDPAMGGFPDDAIVNGVRFCRAVAEEDGAIDPARMVVLLSLGGHDGAHDGEGAFERALAEQARSLPIVVAAGNDGARAVHATARLFGGERSAVDVRVPRSSLADAEVALTIRIRGSFAVESPSGEVSEWIEGARELALDGARITVAPLEDAPGLARLGIAARDGALASGTYRLLLRGPSEVEVWLAGARLGATFFAPSLGGPHVRTDEAIAIPATAEPLIAVGATISRPRVSTQTGELVLDGAAGDRAAFSSVGPTPDGAPKPDLVAPGGWVLAALSSDVRDGDPENLAGGALAPMRARDGRIAVRGTSVSAAVVAGALLLALELDPSVGPDARALLIASARGEGWSPERGAGELDVPALLSMTTARDAAVARASITATRPLVPTDDRLWLVARSIGASGAPAGDRLGVSIDGHRIEVPMRYGVALVPIAPPPSSVGVPLIVSADVDGAPIDPLAVPVVIERSPRGAVLPAGGGCAIAARSDRLPLVLIVLAAWIARRRLR